MFGGDGAVWGRRLGEKSYLLFWRAELERNDTYPSQVEIYTVAMS